MVSSCLAISMFYEPDWCHCTVFDYDSTTVATKVTTTTGATQEAILPLHPTCRTWPLDMADSILAMGMLNICFLGRIIYVFSVFKNFLPSVFWLSFQYHIVHPSCEEIPCQQSALCPKQVSLFSWLWLGYLSTNIGKVLGFQMVRILASNCLCILFVNEKAKYSRGQRQNCFLSETVHGFEKSWLVIATARNEGHLPSHRSENPVKLIQVFFCWT